MVVGDIKVILSANTRGLMTGLTAASASVRTFGRQMSTVATGAKADFLGGMNQIGIGIQGIFRTISIAAAAMGLAVTVAFGFAIKAGADFEDAILRAAAITSEAGPSLEEDYKRMAEKARYLGRETLYSATEVALGMQVMARAGFEVEKVIGAMPAITDAAIVADAKLADITRIVISTMNQYKLGIEDTAKISDVLVAASNKADVTIEGLGHGMSFVGSAANSLGVSLEQTAAIIGLAAKVGIDAGSAGAGLRRALFAMISPGNEAAKIFEKYGIKVKDAKGEMRDFSDIITDFEESKIRPEEMEKIFGLRAVTLMMGLAGLGGKKMKDLTKAIEESGGIAAKTSQIFRKSLKGRVDDLKATFIELGIVIKNAFVGKLAEATFGVRNFVNDVAVMLKKNDKLKLMFEAVGSAMSPFINKIKEVASAFLLWLENLKPEDVKKKVEEIASFIKEKFEAIRANLEAVGPIIIDAFRSMGRAIGIMLNIFIKLPSGVRTIIFLALALKMLGGGALISGLLLVAKAITAVVVAIAGLSIAKLIALLALTGPQALIAGLGALAIGGAAYGAYKVATKEERKLSNDLDESLKRIDELLKGKGELEESLDLSVNATEYLAEASISLNELTIEKVIEMEGILKHNAKELDRLQEQLREVSVTKGNVE